VFKMRGKRVGTVNGMMNTPGTRLRGEMGWGKGKDRRVERAGEEGAERREQDVASIKDRHKGLTK
jgi:hypothetical protein